MTKHNPERAADILAVINDYQATFGYAPSVREIAVRVGLASTSAVWHHLTKLERAGLLERGVGKGRAIRVTQPEYEDALMAVLMDKNVAALSRETSDRLAAATSLILRRRNHA